jgi:hypothetical protein
MASGGGGEAGRIAGRAEGRDFLHRVLLEVRRTMVEAYGMREVAIKSVGSRDARLSIPLRISGVDGEGQRVRYFGKLMGESDIVSSHSIQLFKNIWLRVNGAEPLFGMYGSVEEMVHDQYERLLNIHRLGVPTSTPLGYHQLEGGMWLLVVEFLDARPVSEVRTIGAGQVDAAFGHLRRMHRGGVHHGDIKPDNIMVDDVVRILDLGQFDAGAPDASKEAYDVASMVCSFLGCLPEEDIVHLARKHFHRRLVRAAAGYVALVQRRPDFDFDDAARERLERLMRAGRAGRAGGGRHPPGM